MKCIVLDRDGTLIEHIPYLHRPAQVHLLPTVREGLGLLAEAGMTLVLHTNQSGVGRGMFTEGDVEACNAEMLRQIGDASVFHRICVAPEHAEAPAVYRKPSPKLGRELMTELRLTTKDLCYVGDNTTDLLTASNLGCLGIGVDTGGHDLKTVVPATPSISGFPVVESFIEAARLALAS